MIRDILLNSICPMSRVYDCCIADGDYDCDNCKRLTKEWFDKYDKQIRAEVIDKVNKKLDELERNYESCYGAKIIEMYADVYETFKKWLKEQEKNEQIC